MNSPYSGTYQIRSSLLNEPLPSRITQVDENTSYMSFIDTNNFGNKSLYSSFNGNFRKQSLGMGKQLMLKDSTNLAHAPFLRRNSSTQQLKNNSQSSSLNDKVSDCKIADNFSSDKHFQEFYGGNKQNWKMKEQRSLAQKKNNYLTEIAHIDEGQENGQGWSDISQNKQKEYVGQYNVLIQNEIRFSIKLPIEIVELKVEIECQLVEQSTFEKQFFSGQNQSMKFAKLQRFQ